MRAANSLDSKPGPGASSAARAQEKGLGAASKAQAGLGKAARVQVRGKAHASKPKKQGVQQREGFPKRISRATRYSPS